MTTDGVVREISRLAQGLGVTVGAAESLTGGAVSSALAAAPAAGSWYRGSVVAYMPNVKHGLLEVPPVPLISEECAGSMAGTAARLLGADVVVSATGAGGPDEEEGHPPGTAVIGLCVRDTTSCRWVHEDGDPEQVVQRVRDRALEALLAALREV